MSETSSLCWRKATGTEWRSRKGTEDVTRGDQRPGPRRRGGWYRGRGRGRQRVLGAMSRAGSWQKELAYSASQ